jgi:hypothetical protein
VQVLLLAPGADTRVPVLNCADALRRGAAVEVVPLTSDAEVDAALARAEEVEARLVVAGSDAQIRAVVRRMVKRVLPPPSRRPDGLAPHRTIPDLLPIGVLSLAPGAPECLATRARLPLEPDVVATAVLEGAVRRCDLLRNDGGSVTLGGAHVGGGSPWRARIDLDDVTLSDGTEPLWTCAVANLPTVVEAGQAPLVIAADGADGFLDVGVGVWHGRWRRRLEVRRHRGRAVSVSLRPPSTIAVRDDGVAVELRQKRTWWMEQGAWGVYG